MASPKLGEAFDLKESSQIHSSQVHDYNDEYRSTQVRDEVRLARFGKRQQLKRQFGYISTVGITCTLMITWEGLICVFAGGLANGGPAGIVYGFIYAFIGNMLQVSVMAELASMMPISGGQYNWVSILAPPSCSKFLSYLTGWVNVIAWQAATASTCLFAGSLVQGLAVLNHPEYERTNWQTTLIFYAVLFLSLFINTYLARLLPQIEGAVLLVHTVGFFCVLVPLVYLAPHKNASEVFQQFTNEGGWPLGGLSFFVGVTTYAYCFIGIDAASHIAEEIQDAARVIPQSMILSVVINGVLGFAMAIAILFCSGDLEQAAESPTGFPFLYIFENATRSASGATGMAVIIVFIFITACVNLVAISSRMLWAFARENGLPLSGYLSRVEPRTKMPIWAISVTILINMLLALIDLGSTTAFSAFVSLVIASFYSSFILGASVLLWKRLTTSPADMDYGPFTLGKFGVPVIIGALIYSVIGIFFSFFPTTMEVTPMTMNYSVLVFGGALLFSMIFWLLYGRKVYTGPIMEVTQR